MFTDIQLMEGYLFRDGETLNEAYIIQMGDT